MSLCCEVYARSDPTGMVVVDSVAKLRRVRMEGACVEDAVVLGEFTPGDGNGGRYYWDSTSTAADDGLYIVAPNNPSSATGRWVKRI